VEGFTEARLLEAHAPEPVFVLPSSHAEISGGHLYNERLLEAIARITPVRVIGVDELCSVLDAGTLGSFVLDSLDLERVEPAAHARSGRTFTLIVHYLPSMDSGSASLGAERAALVQYDRWVTTGTFATTYVAALVPRPHHVVCVPPPAPRYPEFRRALGLPLRVLVVANVVRGKRILELLQELAARAAASDEFCLDVVGRLDSEPEYAGECQKLARMPPLAGRVRLVGAVPPAQLSDHYGRAHLCVSSSRMETFGMALQEARAAGLPLLAVDAGNVREHIVPGCGELVQSVTELVDVMLGFCRAPERLQPMLELAARNRPSQSYDWAQAARSFLSNLP
jgi:glycosyltransferase involved in cell wall biosynthesis